MSQEKSSWEEEAAAPPTPEIDGRTTSAEMVVEQIPDPSVPLAEETEISSAASDEPESAPAPTLAFLTEEAEAIQRKLDAQGQRLAGIELEIQDVAGALLSQLAGLETQGQEIAKAIEGYAVQSVGALTACLETAEKARQEAYQQAWQSAPLTLRLKFVRELLPDSHALQNVLKEAAALEELRRRGHDLETWFTNYPALFADAAQALLSGSGGDALADEAFETDPANTLAGQALHEAQTALETTLQALGITWVAPAPGDAILADYEVVGDESSPQRDGCVARLRRRGFRFQGRLALPAQVLRSSALRPTGPTVTEPHSATAPTVTEQNRAAESVPPLAPVPQTAEASDLPDWLRMLSQRTFGCDLPVVTSLTAQVIALKDLPVRLTAAPAETEARTLLIDALQPLLPLLGLRYADGLPDIPEVWGAAFLDVREPLLAWLADKIALSLVAPARGDSFDPQTMEALETRRTVHAKEDETVAKLERIGLLWRERPVIRAQVVRYSIGGAP
jgi:hypothetical protein